MTPSVRTLQGSKIKSFKGSSSLCPRGSNSRGFSNLQWHRQMPPKESAGAMNMEEYMRCRVNYVIDHATGLNNAVKLFGMSKNTLYKWMDKLGIENPFGKNE